MEVEWCGGGGGGNDVKNYIDLVLARQTSLALVESRCLSI
jgi:hypothetical protein